MKEKGTATNQEGTGSTYAGTQSGKNDAPDAYQKPLPDEEDNNQKKEPNSTLGDEYASDDSYGKKDNKQLEEGESDGKKDQST